MASPDDKPLTVFQRRWRKFKTLRRGWWSFRLLTVLYLLSFLNPVLVNNKAIKKTPSWLPWRTRS